MYKIYTVSNRLMSANEFNVEPANIICNDVTLPKDFDEASGYNPHNIRAWAIGHCHGVVCVIFASHEQDALDAACDANMMESFLAEEQDYDDESLTGLGNASELHNLSDCWMAEVEFQASRDIKLLIKLARAAEGGHDTLDF